MMPSDSDLHAYVDGRLDPEGRARVDAWLALHPDRAEQIAAWQRDARALRAALTDRQPPENPALDPGRIRAVYLATRRRQAALAAGMLLCLGLGGATGWTLRAPAPTVVRPLPMSDALMAHRLFASDFNADVRAEAVADLRPWLTRHFHPPVALPDLSAAGFTPVGARLLATEQGAAALVLYTHRDGGTISFYMRPPGAGHGRLPRGERRDGELRARYWSDERYNFALVAPADIGIEL